MVETTENQICSPFYIFKPYLLCVALLLVPSIVLTSFLGLGFIYPILFTVSILILSTSFLVKFTEKRKVVLVENNPDFRNLKIEDEVEEKVLQPVLIETVPESDSAQEADTGIVHEFQVDESLDLTSESESTDDDSLNWVISGNVEQNPEILSDDSTSEEDEEGLIEIAIPSNIDSIGKLSEEPKENLQSNLPTFLPESIFKQDELVELLAEMNNEVNEEDNLIEIDISMGSIKCPRFEIEA
ncbi:hypothetical protein REPUB_Repub02eG0242400 [Reevesia pubescens]